ncbi:MAG: type II and III secretion system protein family protein [Aestuariivirga sp.]|nr:type II and III secretion system protein family protein [Aestuariivirga sp.]
MYLSFRNILSSLTCAAAGLSVAASGLGVVPAPPAHATDAAVTDTSGGEQQNGRFLRIGLAKSAVIRLPAEAKDVIVGESAIVDVVLRQKNMAYLFARSVGQTNIFFFDASGQEILHLDLEVALDSKGLKQLIDRSIPGNDIQVDSTGSNIVLKGTASSAQEAKMAEDLARRFIYDVGNFGEVSPVINLLRVAQGDQVMLKVRIVELKRSVLKQLGINLEGSLGGVALQSNPVAVLDDLGSELFESAVGIGSGGNSIDVTIKALEEQGLATTLAEPTLTAISGASASFLAGGEYPYRECEEDDDGIQCSIEFKPYGVTLGFTPTVLAENRIALNIHTEVSELGERIFGIPAIDTRKAQTSVEIPSGGSMMLAGLIKDVTSQDLDGVPGLRNLPVLGALFSSRDYQRNQTELVVIVTPYIAKPVHRQELATPLDRFNQPTDLQQIFLGRLNRVYGTAGRKPDGVYHGKVGHIID